MRHGSLFSGIGGFDLAAEWMGWENIFQVEWDRRCQKLLKQNFKGVKVYGNIDEFDGTRYAGRIDVLSGGLPACAKLESLYQTYGTFAGSSINRRITETGAYWKTEPGVVRVVHGIPDRVDRIKGLGNAIVPQVAFEIFKAIDQMKRLTNY